MDTENQIKASLIVDLYEVRAAHSFPRRLGEPQSIDELHKYNFFDALIAQLSHKYNVDDEDIKHEIRKRQERIGIQNLAS